MCTRPRRGFTLVELVIYLVVLAAGLTGILGIYIQAVRGSADPLYTTQALLLGESLLEEIAARPYADPDGTEAGEGRDTWDDVDDFADYDSGSAPTDVTGVAIAGLSDYRVAIAVEDDTLNSVSGKRVTVTVTHVRDAGVNLQLSAWRFPE